MNSSRLQSVPANYELLTAQLDWSDQHKKTISCSEGRKKPWRKSEL